MARFEPRLITMTAGDDGPVIGRIWAIAEKDLVDLLKRAQKGETPDDLMFELVLSTGPRDA